MTNGNTGTSDIHDYNHQQQGLHQSQHQQQHNPVAIIDTGYYADIVQQPVCVRCSEYYNNGTVSYPIEPCIAVQLHRKAQLGILGSSLFRRLQNTQAIRDHPSTPLVTTLYPLQQSLISTSNRGSTHSSSPCPLPGITTLASLDFKTSHHSHPLSHEAPNSTDPADADHYPDSKRSVWTDITHRVLQLPLPSAPTASLFGSQITAADIATGEDGSRGVFFFFSDIGIRVSGQFKLRIVISRMPQE
ncbi:hypothetical protein BASA50_005847 [Batrachochytrium salamandrivorans]|uniref:Velvet domain-containing protein n=1 Tax=Batrachochytrium salamandrivorans TaxID=1357716 RepID=A0ABQ8FEX4_9FUNG|nr:hypothetical protein BASA50_005847 [Batrachochytrium salamandrivorans]